jgi:lysozyme family protein
MTIADILSATNTAGYSSRFRRWLAFCLKWEVATDNDGNIWLEDVPGDSGGLTFAGLTAKHDGMTADVTAIWVGYTYRERYWIKSQAEALPMAVGECVANYALNCGPARAARFLQSALLDFGMGTLSKGGVTVDGILGPRSLACSWKVPSSRELAIAVISKGNAYYRGIATGEREKFLRGWLNRSSDLRATFCV